MFDWLVWTEQKRREEKKGSWSESDTVSLLPHRRYSHAIGTRLQRPGRREEDKPDRTHRPGHGNTFDSEHKHAITPSRGSGALNTAITSRETRLSLLRKLIWTRFPSPDLLTWEEIKVHTHSKHQHFYFTLLNLDRTRNSPKELFPIRKSDIFQDIALKNVQILYFNYGKAKCTECSVSAGSRGFTIGEMNVKSRKRRNNLGWTAMLFINIYKSVAFPNESNWTSGLVC